MSNPPSPPVAPEPARGRPWGRLFLAGALLAVGALAVFGDEVVSTAGEVLRRFSGGNRLYWSDGRSGWEEIPLAVQVRRMWGDTDRILVPRWKELEPGLAVGQIVLLRPPDPRDVELALVRIDPKRWPVRVFGRADWSRASVATLADEAGMVFAVNGPYFAEDGPLGLVVSDGMSRNRQGSKRAAHFLVDANGRVRIVNQKKASVAGVVQGFQGFPSVMSNRRTFDYLRTGGRGFDIRQVDRRTAACTLASGEVVFLATDSWTSGISLAELATVLGTLGCIDGMAFDGGSSTSLWLSVGGEERDVDGLEDVPVIVGVGPRVAPAAL